MNEVKNIHPCHHWCQQSPINLATNGTFYVKFPNSFLKLDYRGGPFSGQFKGEEGHRNFLLNEVAAEKTPPTIKLGDVFGRLVKIHLHTPSEHDVEGKDHSGEIHLIHEIVSPTSGSELIVVGVFFEEAETSSEPDFFSMWATHVNKTRKEKEDEITAFIDPRKLLPKTDKWYRYEGSLTSEPYSEIVSWLVFDLPLRISSADLRKLTKNAHQPERPVQEINRRFVIRNFQ